MAILRGSVRRITYRNDDTLYTVIKLAIDDPGQDGGRDEVTVVGHFPSVSPGEWLEADGEWYIHGEFGRQFKCASHRKTPPATARGIERYLASGAARGIGPRLAERLVEKFGERTLQIIEKEPHRLLEVEGIGARKKKAIAEALHGEREVRETLVFLEGYGVAPGTAAKIYRQYGAETVAQVRKDPYRLADEVFGIGFKSADAIALEMGVDRDAPMRARAALVHLLNQAGAEGHVYLPQTALFARASEMDIPGASCRTALDSLAASGDVVVEGDGTEHAVYPAFLYRAEVEVARRLRSLAGEGAATDDLFHNTSDTSVVKDADPFFKSLTSEQRHAVRYATAPGGGLMVLTGGPGTGKTTTLRAITQALEERVKTYLLAAPTGRAAKRLKETTGKEARTIHRLLEYSGGEGGAPRFQRHAHAPLTADTVIVDEASMVDLPLMYFLLRALRETTKLILVGDADQLPSVGPGNVLRDTLEGPSIPSVRLSQVFRQAEASRIVVNAHRIQQGRTPISGGEGSDFFFIPQDDSEQARRTLCDLVARRLPNYLGCDPRRDVQALSTVRRGPLGVDNLNVCLQETLNPPRPGESQVSVGAYSLRVGDRVMQVRNNYEKMVFNGDIGAVTAVDPKERLLEVAFADRDDPAPVQYDSGDLHQLTLAYCTSVHKSQGSEYPAIVMPISWVMPSLMNRNLLYTAVTRARRLVVLLGREDALRAYVRNDRADQRYTQLARRLGASTEVSPLS